MKSVNKIVLTVLLFLSIFLNEGCVKTVTPPQVVASQPSYDGADRNGGFIGWATNNNIPYGVITPHARDRYNGLIEKYGQKIIPPLPKDYGIVDNKTNYFISLEALADFAKMNRWFKSGILP